MKVRILPLLVVLALACVTKTRAPQRPAEGARPPYDKHPLDTSIADRRTRDDDAAEVERHRIEHMVLPNAYPGTAGNPTDRSRAHAQLEANRRALGLPRVRPGWRNPSAPQEPGGGGVPGEPGTPATTDSGGCAWVSVGPTNINGRVTSIAIDPTNRDRIYVTSVGGIFRSTDRGRRWQRVSDDFLAAVFASIAVNPDLPSEIFAGGGDPNYGSASWASGLGIWRSTSGGDPTTWSKVSPPELDQHVIYRLRVDPDAPNDVYAATSRGVYIGKRSGAAITFAPLGGFDASATDLAVDFTATPRRLYAGVNVKTPSFDRGLWKWNGTSWQRRDSGIDTSDSDTMALALAPSSPQTIYAKVARENGRLRGVYKTTTGGDAWSLLPAASIMDDARFDWSNPDSKGYSDYVSILEVHPTNANIVYGGGVDIYRTLDGGDSWVSIGAGSTPSKEWSAAAYPYYIHADHHAIAFDPDDPNFVYSGNDGGIDRSTDVSVTPWHWTDIAHGMVMTEFYRIASQQATATLISGGSQDNGTEISFGNRTWYKAYGCDGADVAVDAQNPEVLYANCNGSLFQFRHPVPGIEAGGKPWVSLVAPANVVPPIGTDPALADRALVAAGKQCETKRLLATSNGVGWTEVGSAFPAGAKITAHAAAPSSGFQTYYVGVVFDLAENTCPGFTGKWFPAAVYRTTDAGATAWLTTNTGLPDRMPLGFAIDPSDADRAFVAMSGSGGGAVAMTTDGGASWMPLAGSGMTALPPTASYTGVVIHPSDPNTIFVSSTVGVFRGVISMPGGGAPEASWVPFDEGLPDGTYARDIWLNRTTGILTVGTFGQGAFQRDVRTGAICPPRQLVVRDNVHDRGLVPPPHAVPDPEHPIPDPARPGWYKPNDTAAGRLYWWSSTDIRIDVPSANPPHNQLAAVDHVEFESCPPLLAGCPSGTMRDSKPRRGKPARAYVQVTNRGLQPVTNVKVMALWTDASVVLPLLPPTFWSTTFPVGSTTCGALAAGSGWNAVDPATPCRTIAVVNPEMPEVVRFDWDVPGDAPDHACMLVVIESADDPLDPALRAANERQAWVLVPGSRHIAQRNLHVIDTPSWMGSMLVPNPTGTAGMELVFSQPDLQRPIRVLMPAGASIRLRGARPVDPRLTPEELLAAREMNVHPGVAYEIEGREGALFLPIPPGETWRVALLAESRGGEPNTAVRFSVMARQGDTVLGGNTYVLRHPRR